MRERLALFDGELSTGRQPVAAFAYMRASPWWKRAQHEALARPATRFLSVGVIPSSPPSWLVALEVENLAVNDRPRSVLTYGLVVAVMGVAAVWRRRAPLTFALVVLAADQRPGCRVEQRRPHVAPVMSRRSCPTRSPRSAQGPARCSGSRRCSLWGIVVDVATSVQLPPARSPVWS